MRLDPHYPPTRGVRLLDGADLPAIEPCPFCGTSATWFTYPDERSAEMVPEHRGIMCPGKPDGWCLRPWLSYPTGEWLPGKGNFTVNHDRELANAWNRRPE